MTMAGTEEDSQGHPTPWDYKEEPDVVVEKPWRSEFQPRWRPTYRYLVLTPPNKQKGARSPNGIQRPGITRKSRTSRGARDDRPRRY
jgi:hypothetical protein